ncbi:DUF6879 family protein [Streptomyces sp. NBC_00091]|uniref:DUF6879 family protein n=1 Tax=Streptomyces sp. NBC_00091 TaxID=2975648 RepID=UPI0022536283|nr:DUF6879 family protein [Streptomyces sp. NBC_00091]MCX5377465.1 hypothetical protein [Streptomyces sp. NBC_00091]
MHDLRAPALPANQGEPLGAYAYTEDLRARRAAVRNGESWRLERLQHFEETDDPTREALRRGDWREVLRLIEAERIAARRAADDDSRNGSPLRRLRVVEEPLSPYVQWQLHWLHMRAEAGHHTRVLSAEEFSFTEAADGGPLPEIVIVDGHVLYEVLYTPVGVHAGARRYEDPAVVRPWEVYLKRAYAMAEDVRTYFTHTVAHLPPPPAA